MQKWRGQVPACRGKPRSRPHRFGLMATALISTCWLAAGCASTTLQEVRGKTAGGPEYRNKGDSSSEVRYNVVQGVELKWSNGVTTGASYRRRDTDQGSGDNDNLVLFEVGYPLWKAAKKPEKSEKTSERLEDLQREVAELRGRLAELSAGSPNAAVASAGK